MVRQEVRIREAQAGISRGASIPVHRDRADSDIDASRADGGEQRLEVSEVRPLVLCVARPRDDCLDQFDIKAFEVVRRGIPELKGREGGVRAQEKGRDGPRSGRRC